MVSFVFIFSLLESTLFHGNYMEYRFCFISNIDVVTYLYLRVGKMILHFS